MRIGRTADPIPSFRQVQALDPRDPPAVAGHREELWLPGPFGSFPIQRHARNGGSFGLLRGTKVGSLPGLALYGFQGEESELDEIELVASDEGSDSDNEEDGPGPP